MRIDYTLRPTMIKSNARHRGPTESGKYFNTVHEALHDITLLGKIMDRDDFIFSLTNGQTNFIEDNIAVYFSGEDRDIYSNVDTATLLIGDEGIAIEDTDLLSGLWTTYGGCQRTLSAGSIRLSSPGTTDPCGVKYSLDVQEGQIIYIRAFVKVTSGSAHHFAIGSQNVNNGIGSIVRYDVLPDGLYVGHFIECKQKEGITINIDVNNGAESAFAGEVEISDLSIRYVDRSELYLQPINTDIKAQINVLDSEIQNIIKNM
jgi:hypothetical protein